MNLPLERLGIDPEGRYFARSFWDGASGWVQGGLLELREIPPHGARLLSLRPSPDDWALYLGGNLHISQGLEIAQWTAPSHEGVRLQLDRPGKAQGEIELYLPRPPKKAILNQQAITWRPTSKFCYTFPVSFNEIDVPTNTHGRNHVSLLPALTIVRQVLFLAI